MHWKSGRLFRKREAMLGVKSSADIYDSMSLMAHSIWETVCLLRMRDDVLGIC